MKYSRQRELVLNSVLRYQVHPTADFVYSRLRSENPSISLGTVYRNLNLLAELGRIHRIGIPGQSDRYDGRLDEHYHMICETCNEVFDVELDLLDELDQHIERNTGFMVRRHDLIISGECIHCKQKSTATMADEK